MGYVLDDYVVSGYVQGYSVTVTGVSASFAIPNITAYNVEATIAKPLGVSVNTAVKIKTILDSVAPITGVKATTKLGDCYVTVRHPGMSIDFIQFTPPKLLPNPTHNNAGESIAGLFSYLNPIPEPLYHNLTGAEGNLTHTLPYYSAPLSYIYNEGNPELYGYQVTTSPGNRELYYGIITSDKYLEILVYNKRRDSITLVSNTIPEEFGCSLSGINIGETINSGAQKTIRITARLLAGEAEIFDSFPLIFDKVTLNVTVSIYRQPIVVYSIYPNRNSYSESYSFKTSIFESTNKKEKRRAMMEEPKRAVRYEITPTSASDATFIQNTIYSGYYDVMYQPLWAFATKNTQALVSGTAIICDTYMGVFSPGDYVGIYINEQTTILSRIYDVTSTTIYIAQEITVPIGSWIVPLMVGTPETSNSNISTVATDQKLTLSFLEL